MTELQDFIATYIGSVEQLEILLLLQKDPERSWSAKEISVCIRSSLESVGARLQGLLNNGLISKDESGLFKYHPPSESMDQKVKKLEIEYSQKRSTIINMIYTGVSRPKVNQAVQSLADAFKINRGDI